MKTIKILTLSFLITFAAVSMNAAKAQVSVSADVTFSVFHDNLSPYGRWVNHPSYGQVWISNERDFVPYRTNGHWVYTDDGWTWVSNYDWGWAPFHYGRWDYDASYGGYFWVPGYEWGPAWVSWRSSNEDYGWAPLRPGINVGIGISFGSDIPAERWTFVPNRYIASPYVNRYYVDNRRNVTIINNTTIINNVHNNNSRVVVVGGPRRGDVERVTRTRINTYTVANNSRPGTVINRNTVNIYRPVVNKTTVINKTVVNQHNKTVINNNSNNKTVVNNRNSNNKTVVNNRVNANKTVVNNRAVNNTVNNKTTVNANKARPQVTNKTTVRNQPKAQPARQQPQRPAVTRQQPNRNVAKPQQPQRPAVSRPAPRPQPQQRPAEHKPNHQ